LFLVSLTTCSMQFDEKLLAIIVISQLGTTLLERLKVNLHFPVDRRQAIS